MNLFNEVLLVKFHFLRSRLILRQRAAATAAKMLMVRTKPLNQLNQSADRHNLPQPILSLRK